MTTPLNEPVLMVPSMWLVIGRPTKTVAFIGIVSLPTTVQLVPVGETEAVNVSPMRTSRTQYGAFSVADPAVLVDTPPAATRRWKATPFAELTNIDAWAEFAASELRTM